MKMRSFSGIHFDPANPDPSVVNIIDIANSLSRICRYGGHCRRDRYSVAEHSLHVMRVLEENPGTRHLALSGLMHDAAESMVGDVVSALKTSEYMKGFKDLEKNWEHAIDVALNLHGALSDMSYQIKVADLGVRRMEIVQFVEHAESDLLDLPDIGSFELPEMSRADACSAFLRNFHRLTR